MQMYVITTNLNRAVDLLVLAEGPADARRRVNRRLEPGEIILGVWLV